MALYIILDGTSYEVTEESASESEPEVTSGVRRRAFDGTPRSSEQGEKRVFNYALYEMTEAQLVTLKAKFALGRVVAITGDFCPAGNYIGKVMNAGYVSRDLIFKRTPSIQVTQV